MKAMHKKILRVQRLRTLEQGKLDSMVAQLAAIESHLTNQSQQLAALRIEINNAATLGGHDSVEQHAQTIVWVDHLQRRVNDLNCAIKETESQRNEMRDQVLKQQAKVRGWESSIDRISSAVTTELQKQESLVADDRYLHDRLAR